MQNQLYLVLKCLKLWVMSWVMVSINTYEISINTYRLLIKKLLQKKSWHDMCLQMTFNEYFRAQSGILGTMRSQTSRESVFWTELFTKEVIQGNESDVHHVLQPSLTLIACFSPYGLTFCSPLMSVYSGSGRVTASGEKFLLFTRLMEVMASVCMAS